MIVEWKLENFKNIRQAKLEFKGLTLIAGANNAGKSSLIQSILLVSQTLASRATAKKLELNGQLFRFGYFSDVKPLLFPGGPMSFEFTYLPKESQGNLEYHLLGLPKRNIKLVKIGARFGDFLWGHDCSRVELNPFLLNADVICDYVEGETNQTASMRIELCPSESERIAELQCSLSPRVIEEYWKELLYLPTFDDLTQEFMIDSKFEEELVGCRLEHFLPSLVLLQFNSPKRLAANVVGGLSAPSAVTGYRYRPYEDYSISSEVIQFLKSKIGPEFESFFHALGDSVTTVEQWQKTVRGLPHNQRKKFQSALFAVEDEVEKIIVSELKQTETYDIAVSTLPVGIADAVRYAGDFFVSSVKYLGPLREEARAVFPLPMTNASDDVGLKGEYSASVLHEWRELEIEYIKPSYFFDGPKTVSRSSLIDAVSEWLRYLQMGESVDTTDAGNLGHMVRVTPKGTTNQVDLRHMGVGVSQLLPVLVFGLLGRIDGTLLMEQPELHLHPLAQTRLADFLLSLVLAGKQCIVETHSEHIVKRLRMRTAQDDSDELSSLIKIYFAYIDGDTKFREIEINEFGAVVDWPEGFFDQSEKESQEILRAAVNKRKKRKTDA